MRRILTLAVGTFALLWAAAGQSQVVGTVVSTDPAANTVVVRSADGKQVVYRTGQTTTIHQGGSAIELRALQPGAQVQILADPSAPAVGGTTVYPMATGIVVAPASPPKPVVERRSSHDHDVHEDLDDDHEVEDDD